MWPARLRLAVAALLFTLWIGWLVFLAVTTTHPVVLSRPQFLVATLYVIADLRAAPDHPDHPAPVVRVEEVGWSDPGRGAPKPGDELTVPNLSLVGPAQGWDGPGTYILPLTKHPADGGFPWSVTPVPRSPGFSGGPDRLRIYRLTEDTRGQLGEIEPLRQ